MKLKKIAESKQQSIGLGIGVGVSTEIIISIIGAVIVTSMLIKETVPVGSMKILAFAIRFFATAIGGIIACTMTKGKYALTAGITAIVYCFILVAISVLIYDSVFGGFWTSLLSICLGYVISCTICITKVSGRRNRNHMRR